MAHYAQLGRVAAGLLLAAAASAQGPGGRSAQRGNVWIDPDRSEPAGTHYRLFATPSRGAGTEASYLIYLPPDYDTAARRYPVLYWLHGGGGSQREGGWMVARIDGQIRAGNLPPFMVVLAQGLPDVRYMNSKDGTRPLEDVVIKDLLPHVDATYRTMATRQGRAIEGMSMGGFGSLRLGFKFPELFGTVSALAPSIKEMKDELPIVLEPFGNDPAYYEEVGPWNIVRQHAAAIRGRPKVRLLVGDQDSLLPFVEKYSAQLTSLKIDHQYAVAPGAHHRYDEIIERAPFDAVAFWKTVFEQH
ncbi:MAG: alpha/beta hydrolase-fold protein [Candidatus Solibacter sp.]|nr:alpha/beta hydrolase-fold protein [Candidatus Solibacter sp.]